MAKALSIHDLLCVYVPSAYVVLGAKHAIDWENIMVVRIQDGYALQRMCPSHLDGVFRIQERRMMRASSGERG